MRVCVCVGGACVYVEVRDLLIGEVSQFSPSTLGVPGVNSEVSVLVAGTLILPSHPHYTYTEALNKTGIDSGHYFPYQRLFWGWAVLSPAGPL